MICIETDIENVVFFKDFIIYGKIKCVMYFTKEIFEIILPGRIGNFVEFLIFKLSFLLVNK